jgi:ribosomal protein L32
MQLSSLRPLRLCGESKVARGDAALACGPLGRPQAGSYVVSTRWLVGARLRATCWISPQRRRGRRGAMADAASSLRSLHLCGELKVARGDAALTCGPLGRSQAGSYVVSTRWLVGARLRATRWILTQRRRGRRGVMADAASSLRSLRLCGESKVARGRCRARVQSAESPASGLLRR